MAMRSPQLNLVVPSSILLPNPNRKTLALVLLASLLCVLSYLIGIYSNYLSSPLPLPTSNVNPNNNCLNFPSLSLTSPQLDFLPHHAAADTLPPIAQLLPPIPLCAPNFTDYVPCHPPNSRHRERRCPPPEEKPPRCRVPKPKGYRRPIPWPESRNRIWFANVPSKTLIEAKKDQHWVVLEGEQLVFPGGGTSFPDGVKKYVERMARLVPLRSGEIRTVLDIGCGVASFGGHLLDYNVLTMSVAPRDVHEAQVQFALERGLPAMLGVLNKVRLPFPSRSFDMGHCARCLIDWAANGGKYILEIDRVLRPGGYWVLSGPPINWKNMHKGWQRTPEDLKSEQKAIEDIAEKLCWEKVVEKDIYAVWRKPTNHIQCSEKSKHLEALPFCDSADPDAGWYKKMNSCITPLPEVNGIEELAGGALAKWPGRLNAVPPRIHSGSIVGLTAEELNQDNKRWSKRVSYYGAFLNFVGGGRFRNVMDMNAGMGGFAAAMLKYPVWVMNAVPVNVVNNTLGIIYERGLIGTYIDWCESFSTYARTYDLLHANGVLSIYMEKCGLLDILLEMDRIIRPGGAMIIRDHVDVLVKTRREADRLHWHSYIVNSEMGPLHPEKLLIVDNSSRD